MWPKVILAVAVIVAHFGGGVWADDLPDTIADPSFLPDRMPDFADAEEQTATAAVAAEPAAKTGPACDAIVGGWQWENGNVFVFTADKRWSWPGTAEAGSWRCQVNSLGLREVRITPDQGNWWTVVQIAPDGMRLSGIGDDGNGAVAVRLSEPVPDMQGLIGTLIEGAFEIDGWQDMGGGLLEEPLWFSQYSRADGAQLVLIQWSLPRRKGSVHGTFQVTDVLATAALPAGSTLAFFCREAPPNVTRKVIAAVRADLQQEWWRDVQQAWAIDLSTGRIRPVPLHGIECVNEGWGN